MNFLKCERAILEKLHPGLDAALAKIPLMEMERSGNPSIAIFRHFGGPGMLIPTRFGGRGASPLEALRAQRAIACRAPSLAVATTMHHFTIASLMEINPEDPGLEGELLSEVARGNLYIGSGFRGRKDRNQHPDIVAVRRTQRERLYRQWQQEAVQPVAIHGFLCVQHASLGRHGRRTGRRHYSCRHSWH